MIISSAVPLLAALLTNACVDGNTGSCTLAGCLKAQRTCVDGAWDECTCIIATCDDGNFCTTDTFNGTACVHTARTNVACDDGNACTLNEKCSSAGVCGSGTANEGASCGDGNVCNGAEVCSSAGACVPGNPPSLEDGNPCTYDYCDAAGGHHDSIATCPAAPPATEEAYSMPIAGPSPIAHAIATMPNIGGPVVDLSNGVATYDYAFGLPAARGRFQPAIALRYSSGSAVNRGFGAGWDLTDYYIEVDVSTPPTGATDSYPKRWRISLGDAVSELRQVAVSGAVTTFKPTIQGRLVEAQYTVNGTSEIWTATDLVGNAYTFEDRFTFGGAGGRGRWYLSKVTDVDGNESLFTHVNSRLTAIRYNSYVVGGTKHYATNVDLEYSMTYQAGPYAFPIGPAWYQRVGDYVTRDSLYLQAVKIKGSSEAGSPPFVLGHWLYYRLSAKGVAPILESVNVFAGEGQYVKTLPPTEFAYGAEAESYSMGVGKAVSLAVEPAASPGLWKDLDGDGLPDRVIVDPTVGLSWQRNRTAKGSGAPLFDPIATVPGAAGLQVAFGGNPVKAALLDMNGDGLADLVRVVEGACGLEIRLGQIVSGQFRISTSPLCP